MPLLGILCALTVVSCKSRNVDVEEICAEISESSFAGTSGVRGGAVIEGKTLIYIEYTLQEGSKAIRSEARFGGGVNDTARSAVYSYTWGDFMQDGNGRYITFVPENEGDTHKDLFKAGALVENGKSLTETVAKIKYLPQVNKLLTNHTYKYENTEYWLDTTAYIDQIKVDTILKRTGRTTFDTILVFDTIYGYNYDTLGMKSYYLEQYTFNMDRSYNCTGSMDIVSKNNNHELQPIDSLTKEKHLHFYWIPSSFSGKKVTVTLFNKDNEQESEDVGFSNYSVEKGEMNRGDYLLIRQ